jgi:uncharacterized protein YjbI with pentapeptide repeats
VEPAEIPRTNSGKDLVGVNLSDVNLSCANLSGFNLKAANISHSNLSNADLSGASLDRAYLVRVNLNSANLSRADLSRADLSNADLKGANLAGANLAGANLKGADLSRANLSRADLSGAYLGDADLGRANLSGADLSGADLSNADLNRVNLNRADLNSTYLSQANLSRAYLSLADLSRADLSGTDLSHSYVKYAQFGNNLGITDTLQHDLEKRGAIFGDSLEIPKQEKTKELIGDFVKILLEAFQIDCECFGSTPFKRADMGQGVEPDESFYIQNQAFMREKDGIDLTVDPAPDLAVEIDIASPTPLSLYERLGVSELWQFDGQRLQINLLRGGKYFKSDTSPNFANLPLTEKIPEFIEQSKAVGRSQALRAFRSWVYEQVER